MSWNVNEEQLLCHGVLADTLAPILSAKAGTAFFRAFIVRNRATGAVTMKYRFKYADGKRNWFIVTPRNQNAGTVEELREGISRIIYTVEFVPSGRGKAQCAPNPAYPNGIELDWVGESKPFCKVDLPYPAPECGHHHVRCLLCGVSVAITAAGRADDPRSITLPCQLTDEGGTVS